MLFLDIDFFMFLHRFWGVLSLQVGRKLVVLGSQDAPKNFKNPIFGGHVSKILVKRLRKCAQGAPDIEFWMMFEGFGNVFSSFWAIRINFLDQKLQVPYVLVEWRHHLKNTYLQTSSHMSQEGRRCVRSTRNLAKAGLNPRVSLCKWANLVYKIFLLISTA